MEYSTWKIWFSPRRARREMEALAEKGACAAALGEECNHLSAGLAESQARLQALECELAEVREKLDSRESELLQTRDLVASIRATNEELERSLREASDRLEEQGDIESKIREFEMKLEGFDAVRMRYEERIARLRRKIAELKKANGESDPEARELLEIDMESGAEKWDGDPPATRTRQASQQKAKENPDEPDADWLENLPEG